MALTLTFKCGHQGTWKEGQEPICSCGERIVTRSNASHPRIVGRASGPHVVTKDLDPAIVSLAKDGPLALKTEEPTS